MMDVNVYRVPMASPSDVSEVERLIEGGEIKAEDVVGIIAQTEGDPFARGYAKLSFELLFSKKLGIPREEVDGKIPLLMIGMCEGLMSPHATIFVKKEVEAPESKEKRLAIGVKVTRDLLPEEYGTVTQVRLVAEVVKEGMKEAGIDNPKDVHCVEVKCPALTVARIEEAAKRGRKVRTTDLGRAAALSRGASALGVALALGEVKESELSDEVICQNWNLYSEIASTSAGTEQTGCKVIVLGNSPKSISDLVIGHGVMKDALDTEGVKEALRSAGLKFDCCPSKEELNRVVNVFVNAGANGLNYCRGRRHTMNTDFLSSFSGMHAKAVANAVVASITGDPMVLASAGYEHQGPLGSNLVAVFVKVK